MEGVPEAADFALLVHEDEGAVDQRGEVLPVHWLYQLDVALEERQHAGKGLGVVLDGGAQLGLCAAQLGVHGDREGVCLWVEEQARGEDPGGRVGGVGGEGGEAGDHAGALGAAAVQTGTLGGGDSGAETIGCGERVGGAVDGAAAGDARAEAFGGHDGGDGDIIWGD